MFDIGFGELLLLFIIGLLILGPERLPRVAAQLGRWVGKARRTANQLRHQLEREMAEADIREHLKNKPKKRPSPGQAHPGVDKAADAATGDEAAASKDRSAAGEDTDEAQSDFFGGSADAGPGGNETVDKEGTNR